MVIRRYVADDVPTVVAQVRSELGSDAVILRVRKVRAHGLAGILGRRRVEVLATYSCRPEPSSTGRAKLPDLQSVADAGPSRTSVQLYDSDSEINGRPESPENWTLLATNAYLHLLKHEFEARLAYNLVASALKESEGQAQSEFIRSLRSQIEKLIMVSSFDANDRHVVVLMGPTGSGKTTTVAKLAAMLTIKGGKRVTIYCHDIYKLAGAEQLKKYGAILGVPVITTESAEQLYASLRDDSHSDVSLIDIAGFSYKDKDRAKEVHDLLKSIQPDEVHLTISCHMRYTDVLEISSQYDTWFNRLIFTKLDETNAYGLLFNVAARTGVPVSYLTVGQRVPEDIIPASPAFLSSLVMDHGCFRGDSIIES